MFRLCRRGGHRRSSSTTMYGCMYVRTRGYCRVTLWYKRNPLSRNPLLENLSRHTDRVRLCVCVCTWDVAGRPCDRVPDDTGVTTVRRGCTAAVVRRRGEWRVHHRTRAGGYCTLRVVLIGAVVLCHGGGNDITSYEEHCTIVTMRRSVMMVFVVHTGGWYIQYHIKRLSAAW